MIEVSATPLEDPICSEKRKQIVSDSPSLLNRADRVILFSTKLSQLKTNSSTVSNANTTKILLAKRRLIFVSMRNK